MMLKSRLLPFQQNARNCRKRRRTGWSSRQSWTTAWSASSSAGTATCSRDTTRPSASSATGPAWLPGAKKVILKTSFFKKNGQILASFCIFSSFSQDKFKKYNWGNSHRDRSIHIERACSTGPVDKIKPVFIYCRFNISWIRKTIFENKNMFCMFLKCPSLA